MRTIGRRPLFFSAIGVICLVLVPFTPGELRWVPWAMAGLSGLWTVLFGAEDLLRPAGPRAGKQSVPEYTTESPFGPPPPPGA